MNDETINIILLVMMIFVFMSFMRGRRASRRHRQLEQTIDHLRSVPVSAQAPAALPGASREQIERLEERVRVLERIVTDRNYTLAAQIEALRDPDETLVPVREVERSN